MSRLLWRSSVGGIKEKVHPLLLYRGTSLISKHIHLAPHRRTMPRGLSWSTIQASRRRCTTSLYTHRGTSLIRKRTPLNPNAWHLAADPQARAVRQRYLSTIGPQAYSSCRVPGGQDLRRNCPYRGTSLKRNRYPVGPYSRTMPKGLWWS